MRPADLLVSAAFLASASSAADATERRRIDLPGGRLGDALVALGRQAGISIGVTDPGLADRAVRPVRGTMTVEEALRRLLSGADARYVVIDSRTILVTRRPVSRRAGAQRDVPPARSARRPDPPLAPDEEVEIVVSATKRPIRLAAVPGTVDVVEGDDPALTTGLRGSDALVARLAGVTSTHLGPGRNKLFIRGIADSSFAGPTQATVGQYLGEIRLNYNAPDPDLRLIDLDRVEILSGPQGTLYGAGSLGGIIRMVPNAPDAGTIEAHGSAGAAQTAHGEPGFDVSAIVNLPLVENRVAVRLVGYASREGGYVDDLRRNLEDVNRVGIGGGRVAVRSETSGWTIDLGAAAQRIRGDDAQFADRDAPPLSRRSAVRQDFAGDYAMGSLTATRDWGDLRSVTALGLVRQTLRERFDATRAGAPPTLFEQANRIELFSWESRLSSRAAGGSGWLAGISFVGNRSRQGFAAGDPEAPDRLPGVENAVVEGTLYGEGSVRLGSNVTATAGARFTLSRMSGAAVDVPSEGPEALRSIKETRTTATFLPSASVAISATPNLFLFLRYQEGFRPGGLAVVRGFDGRPIGDVLLRFRSDHVAAVEAGMRYAVPGIERLRFALSASYTRWTDVQADVVDFTGRQTTSNIGDGRILTLDLGFDWRPLPGLSLGWAALLNDSRITRSADVIALGGPAGAPPPSPIPNVARFNGRFGAEYRLSPGGIFDLRLTADARYVGRSVLGVGEVLDEEQGDWLDVGLGARAERGRHAIVLSIANLLDSVGNRFAVGSPPRLIEQRQVTPLRPRTVRVGFEMSF